MNVPLRVGADPAAPPGVELLLGEPGRPPLCWVGGGPVNCTSSRTRLEAFPDPKPRSAKAPVLTAAINQTAVTTITVLRA
jgi:hypothetical protein